MENMTLHMLSTWRYRASLFGRRPDRTPWLVAWLGLNCMAAWVLGPISLVSAAEATFPSKEEQRFSVRDFGAVGDGKAVDRVPIQKAIEAANKAGGGTVYFPEGIYKVTAPHKEPWTPQIKLCRNLTMRGEGMYQSVIRIADDQGPYDLIFLGVRFDFSAFTDRWESEPSGQLQNFEMRGNRISGAYANGIDIHCEVAGIRALENVIIDPARGDVESVQKCAIRLRGVLSDVSIVDNSIYVNTKPKLSFGINDEAKHIGPPTMARNRMQGRYATDLASQVRPKSGGSSKI